VPFALAVHSIGDMRHGGSSISIPWMG
jgi:hypothetical protein